MMSSFQEIKLRGNNLLSILYFVALQRMKSSCLYLYEHDDNERIPEWATINNVLPQCDTRSKD